MKIRAYERFHRAYQTLPEEIQRKVDKHMHLMVANIQHPSLHSKKIKGREDIWEARVDLHYRMTYEIVDDTILLRVVGNHDEILRTP